MEPLLEVKQLQIVLNRDRCYKTLVHDMSFVLKKGKTLAIIGESGSGKSLTALSLLQLLPANIMPTEGSEAWYEGENLFTASHHAMARWRGKCIAMIFQEPMTCLNPVLTVGQQLLEVLRRHTALSLKACEVRIHSLLEEVGLSDATCAAYPHQLSGGMKQRVMIAMALLCEPDILIADEVTTALDVTLQGQIMALLQSLQQRYGVALLFITHDLGAARSMAHDLVVMQEGRAVERGTVAAFFSGPREPYSRALLAASPRLERQPSLRPPAEDLLSVQDMRVHFPMKRGLLRRPRGWKKAVDGVSFNLQRGETLGIVGESGSGKSTLAKALVQLIPLTSGSIQWRCPSKNGSLVQMVFQDPYASMNPRMMIVDILSEGLRAHKLLPPRAEWLEELGRLLQQVGMDAACLHRYPHEFSGGQRQRLCIARALTLKPRLLICDEPTSALDVMTQRALIGLLKDLQKQWDMAYLFISHDLAVVSQLAHKVMVMQGGKVREYGTAQQVLHAPRDAYTRALVNAKKGG